MLQVRIDPIAKDIEVLVAESLAPEARAEAFATIARDTRDEAAAANAEALGHTTPVHTFVDGREGAPEETVRPGGTVVYEFDLLTDLFAYVFDQLQQHSPVLTGSYRASHLFFADDESADPKNPPAGMKVGVFVSDTPYARKIEGDSNRAPESPKAPDGVYEVVAALASRRFGNIAKISFGWRSLNGGAIGQWAQTPSARARGAKRGSSEARQTDWLTRQPAIVITVR
jgi:hypothetical protein